MSKQTILGYLMAGASLLSCDTVNQSPSDCVVDEPKSAALRAVNEMVESASYVFGDTTQFKVQLQPGEGSKWQHDIDAVEPGAFSKIAKPHRAGTELIVTTEAAQDFVTNRHGRLRVKEELGEMLNTQEQTHSHKLPTLKR